MFWERVGESLGGGRFWSALLVVLLVLTVSRSTATVHWVDGIDVITLIALGGAIVMGVLALAPVREPVALGIGFVLAPIVAVAGSWQQIHARYPGDVLGPQLIGVWLERIKDGVAVSDPSFYLILICLLMWITGAWLAWCVLRWRKPMLGLIPGAAAFATNVLNVPEDQNGYTLAMLVLTLALLLWTNYTSSVASAQRASVKLSGDARWDFWESGLVAMAVLIVLGIMLPPLSTADRTLDVESGLFSSWAQLQQQLSRPGIFTAGPGGRGVTGFSQDVQLNGKLIRTRDVVFTYTSTDFSSRLYFRGVNETVTRNGEWRYADQGNLTQVIGKNDAVAYGENYKALAVGIVTVTMLRPPAGYGDLLFYPGQLYKVDRLSRATQAQIQSNDQSAIIYSVDKLSTLSPATSTGKYVATAEYSTATAAELEAAGTEYPDWVGPFSGVPPGYRSPDVMDRIHNLALRIVNDAHATTPYDEAAAIETYLRNPSNFTYSLDAKTPPGVDPIDYFLFTSHTGYCEFFATAMGDMLRSLGIPARLASGYGPGTFDTQAQDWVVRSEDAHTWVEVYFPQYGWIPFEPTADSLGLYQLIPRGASGVQCFRDEGCDTPSSGGTVGGTTTTPTPQANRGERNDPATGPLGGGIAIGGARFDTTVLMRAAGVVVALLLLLLVLGLRYLRPRTVMAVWKRTLTLTELAGARGRPGETPLELGRRLQRTFPEAAEPAAALASGFVVAAYAPPDIASTARGSVMEAWTALRPMLLRRVFRRLRPGRL
jgi:transglutaminase-like putative cysteine protease